MRLRRQPYWKLLESTDLTYENGEIQHSYAEFNVELGRKIISLMAVADKGSIIKSAIRESTRSSAHSTPR